MIDLHSHSTFSDGSESPTRIVELAVAAGCSTLALTDHDVLEGVEEARARADELGVGLVPGCEVSCAFAPGTMHVLCYFISPGPSALGDELARLRDDRETRNLKMAQRLAEIGIAIDYDDVVAEAGGRGIGRPHFAAVLMHMGVVASIEEAFDRFLGKGAPAYVSKTRVEAEEIIELCTRSGGVAVLAHPLSLGLEPGDLDRELAALADVGLVGLECYYGHYDQTTRGSLVLLARRHGLVPTGGSDFHGRYKPDLEMGIGTGDLSVPDDVLDELTARRPALG